MVVSSLIMLGTALYDKCPTGAIPKPGSSTTVSRISSAVQSCSCDSQEILSHADALIYPPALQCRTMPSLHPYAALERSLTPMSPVPEPGRRSVGDVPLPPRLQTLLVQW